MTCSTTNPETATAPVNIVGEDAAVLSLVEVGLGSLLHGLKIPLAGHFLSLNQSFFLTRSVRRIRAIDSAGLGAARLAPFSISTIAALLKSLSPAGSKLQPMLGISAQGVLFGICTVLFGSGPIGTGVGSVAASVWAFVQPPLIYYLIFGNTLIAALEYFAAKLRIVAPLFSAHLAQSIVGAAIAVIGTKALLAVAATWAAWHLPDRTLRRYEEKLLAAARRRTERDASLNLASGTGSIGSRASLRGALRDLRHPLFLASLAITGAFFALAESPRATLIWGLLRPLALGFLLFFLVRRFPPTRLVYGLRRLGFTRFAREFEVAVSRLRG